MKIGFAGLRILRKNASCSLRILHTHKIEKTLKTKKTFLSWWEKIPLHFWFHKKTPSKLVTLLCVAFLSAPLPFCLVSREPPQNLSYFYRQSHLNCVKGSVIYYVFCQRWDFRFKQTPSKLDIFYFAVMTREGNSLWLLGYTRKPLQNLWSVFLSFSVQHFQFVARKDTLSQIECRFAQISSRRSEKTSPVLSVPYFLFLFPSFRTYWFGYDETTPSKLVKSSARWGGRQTSGTSYQLFLKVCCLLTARNLCGENRTTWWQFERRSLCVRIWHEHFVSSVFSVGDVER